VGTAVRPLVFVALGTHAGYPYICRSKKCDENTTFSDFRHDGTQPWIGNDDDSPECRPLCVAALPTQGTRAARWNAYDGKWGGAECFLVYCNEADAPKAPGRQGRYKKPWCASRTAGLNTRHKIVVMDDKEYCYPAARR
jgi:hypothetical protein